MESKHGINTVCGRHQSLTYDLTLVGFKCEKLELVKKATHPPKTPRECFGSQRERERNRLSSIRSTSRADEMCSCSS
jgi:hypothetical protein